MPADEFSKIFREEHRCVRDALLDLIDAFDQRDTGRARSLLQNIGGCTSPHFRYEEEALCPAFTDVWDEFVRRYLVEVDENLECLKPIPECADQGRRR